MTNCVRKNNALVFFVNIFILGSILAITQLSFAETALDAFFQDENNYQDVIVEEVLSTDTIKLKSGEKIKLIGLKAPVVPRRKKRKERDEYGFTIKPDVSVITPLEEKAVEFVKELIVDKRIRLEFDVDRKNDEFKTVAYAFLIKDNSFVNAEILRQGFAHLQIRPPNTKYAEALREAYREAKREQRGLQSE